MVNFCLYIFIIYAAAGSANAILFGNRKKKRRVRRTAAGAARTDGAQTQSGVRVLRLDSTQPRHGRGNSRRGAKAPRRFFV